MNTILNEIINSLPDIFWEADEKTVNLSGEGRRLLPSLFIQSRISRLKSGVINSAPDKYHTKVREKAAEVFDTDPGQVFIASNINEALLFLFAAFFNRYDNLYTDDILSISYKNLCSIFEIDLSEIPVSRDLTLDIPAFLNLEGHIFLSNPHKYTGLSLSPEDIKRILDSAKDSILFIDESSIDFANQESAVSLIGEHDNLIVYRALENSFCMSNALVFGHKKLIDTLYKAKDILNPVNINTISQEMLEAALSDTAYKNIVIKQTLLGRELIRKELEFLGYNIIISNSSFLLIKHAMFSREELFLGLKKYGVLTACHDHPLLKDYISVNVTSPYEADIFLETIKNVMIEKANPHAAKKVTRTEN